MTPRKEKALQALLVSRTRAQAAKTAGIGESTLREYMKDPEFLDRYRETFGNLVLDAARQAGQAIAPALSSLREIVEDRGEAPQARIQAARYLVEYALRLGEQCDLLARLERLETAVKEGDTCA